jgi:hypothetical protein
LVAGLISTLSPLLPSACASDTLSPAFTAWLP